MAALYNACSLFSALFPLAVNPSSIIFYFYGPNNNVVFQSNSPGDPLNNIPNCDPTKNVTVIIPGWTESCSTPWVLQLVANLNNPLYNPDGGCIICVDTSAYSLNPIYDIYYQYFESIVEIVSAKLLKFLQYGFNFNLFRLIGFSIGAEIALQCGNKTGQNISRIDAIEQVNVLFDPCGKFITSPSAVAVYVQSIHCSTVEGTTIYGAAHSDWLMGQCGAFQPGASLFPYGSHGLCPYFYVNGMVNPFWAQTQQFCFLNVNQTLIYPGPFGPNTQRMGFSRTNAK